MPDSSPASVPLAIVLSVASSLGAGLLAGGIGWGTLQGQVGRNRESIVELRGAIDAHHAAAGHPVSLEHLTTVDRRLEALERMAVDARAMREDMAQVRVNVAALCRSARQANCAP